MKPSVAAAWVVAAAGVSCTLLAPVEPMRATVFTLTMPAGPAARTDPGPPVAGAERPVLVVALPRARPGYETPRMVYVDQPNQLSYFAHHEWVDAPARLIAPLVGAALERTGRYHAVVLAPTAIDATLRLETELVRLEQDFGARPSRVRLALRVQLVDVATRRVLGAREVAHESPAASDDPEGGVGAAQEVVRAALEDVVQFCDAAASERAALDPR